MTCNTVGHTQVHVLGSDDSTVLLRTFLISTSPKPPFGSIKITSARKYHIKIAKLKGEELELEKECVISTNLKLGILEFYMYTVLKVQVYQVIHIHIWISQVSEASRIFAIEMVGG